MFGKRNRHPRATMNHPNPLTLAAFALAASLSLASPTFGGSPEDVAATPLKAVFQHVNSRPGKPAPEVITDTPEKLEARYRRGGSVIRIISARRAGTKEQRPYREKKS